MADTSEREARRQANFAHARKTSPLPAAITDIALPGGLQLDDDEFVVRTAKDWGVSVKPLVLTTRRLICPSDLSGRAVAAIGLADVQDVQLRKHWIGFATIVVNVADQPGLLPRPHQRRPDSRGYPGHGRRRPAVGIAQALGGQPA